MTRTVFTISLVLAFLFSACSKQSTTRTTSTCAMPDTTPLCDGPDITSWGSLSSSGSNQLTVSVSGTTVCSQNVNLPCTSVTLCVPGSTTKCQTISDILVDTGSYGLRIFSQAIPQNLCSGLNVLTDSSSRDVAECAQFGSGTDWGPVVKADVQLGGEPVVTTSVQIIHRTYGTPSDACDCADNSPSEAGINGILGVGLFTQDCGTNCRDFSDNGVYYGCSGSDCSGTKVALADQVQNPVALLSSDNNGVILDFGSVGSSGTSSLSGTLTLGIDTAQGNNSSAGATKYNASTLGYLSTTFNSTDYTESFIDSGSNVYIINDSSLAQCSDAPGFFCDGTTHNFSASMTGSGGTGGPTSLSFSIADTDSLLGTGNLIFSNMGAAAPSGFEQTFDWGFPFFLGRKVYVGIQGKSSNLGAGPYWAF